jgi:hypothetical protein
MSDADLEAAAAAVMELMVRGIPIDVQELLVRGDPKRGIAPGALSAAFKAAMETYRRYPTEEVGGQR